MIEFELKAISELQIFPPHLQIIGGSTLLVVGTILLVAKLMSKLPTLKEQVAPLLIIIK